MYLWVDYSMCKYTNNLKYGKDVLITATYDASVVVPQSFAYVCNTFIHQFYSFHFFYITISYVINVFSLPITIINCYLKKPKKKRSCLPL